MTLRKNIILLGMKHCGKSTLGALLAERFGCALFDIDDLVEVAYQHRTGSYASARDIFRNHGEEFFARLEWEVVIELGKLLDSQDGCAVISLGGRTILNERARHILEHMGPRVYLQVDPEELYRRVLGTGLPAFLDASDPKGSFMRIFQERRSQYERLANVTVNLDNLGPEAALEALLSALKEHVDER